MNGSALVAGIGTRFVAARGATDLARSVLRRLDAKTLALAVVVILGLGLLGGLGLVIPVWSAPREVQLSRFTETVVTGVVIFFAVAFADEAVDRGAPRLWTYLLAVLAGSVLGAWLGWEVRVALGLRFLTPPGVTLPTHFSMLRRFDLATMGILVGGLATFVHVNRRTALAARLRQHAAERARAAARRRTLESELQALQARVEPMFLFDTLKRIRALYRSDAAAASAMLEDLIVYLRAALPHMRESSSTVEQEATLVCSWLDIVGRAAPGWRIAFHVAEPARTLRLPALVLLPLVQHAVAGVGADDKTFELRFDATTEGDRLRIAIAASTAAFAGGSSGKPLLEEVGSRIRALYGAQARFETHSIASGSEAIVSVPSESGEHALPEESGP